MFGYVPSDADEQREFKIGRNLIRKHFQQLAIFNTSPLWEQCCLDVNRYGESIDDVVCGKHVVGIYLYIKYHMHNLKSLIEIHREKLKTTQFSRVAFECNPHTDFSLTKCTYLALQKNWIRCTYDYVCIIIKSEIVASHVCLWMCLYCAHVRCMCVCVCVADPARLVVICLITLMTDDDHH